MWVMFGAVASHKFVISFCMGMELMNSQAGIRTLVGSILFFGVVTSLGIGIGGAVSTSSTNNLPVAVIEVITTSIQILFFSIQIFYKHLQYFAGPCRWDLGVCCVL